MWSDEMRLAGAGSLLEVFERRAALSPQKIAYTFLADGERESGRITYEDLALRSRAIASALQRGHREGVRVLLLFPPGLDFIAAFLGCLCAGVVAVPAYPPNPVKPERGLDRLRAIADNAGVEVVLTTQALLEPLSAIAVKAPALERARWIPADTVPAGEARHWERPEAKGNTLAVLQYTSGSTAAPKGVMVSHGNLLHNLAYGHYLEENDERSASVSWLPIYHDMGLVEGILQPLYGGYPAYLMPPVVFLQKPLRWLQAISRYAATNSGGPNFAYNLCVSRISPRERRALDLGSWRVAYNGAEPIRWATLTSFYEAFKECGLKWRSLYPVYGLAEATLVVSGGRQAYEPKRLTVCPDSLARDLAAPPGKGSAGVDLTSCGPFSFETEVEIVDPVTRKPCPPKRIGEIWVHSPSVAKGYWNAPEHTRETFSASIEGDGARRFLRTGDLGLIHEGELYVTGRLKDLIIVRGLKLYPQDVERTVEECCEGVRPGCVAAFGVESEEGERLVVAAEMERGQLRGGKDNGAVAKKIHERVCDEFGVPLEAVVLLRPGGVPKTSSGKIRRYAVRRNFLEGELGEVSRWPPASPEGADR